MLKFEISFFKGFEQLQGTADRYYENEAAEGP